MEVEEQSIGGQIDGGVQESDKIWMRGKFYKEEIIFYCHLCFRILILFFAMGMVIKTYKPGGETNYYEILLSLIVGTFVPQPRKKNE